MKQLHTFDCPEALGLGPDYMRYQLTLRLEGDVIVALNMGETSMRCLMAVLYDYARNRENPAHVDLIGQKLLADYQPGWGEEDTRVQP